MREIEIAERTRKYKERIPIKDEIIYSGYGAALALLIFVLLTKEKIFLFLFVTLVSLLINYQTNMHTIRFNPDPEVFSSLMLTRLLGFHYSLLMLAIPTLLVDVYTARFDKDTLISLILTILINYVMSIFPLINFVVLGIILVTIKFIAGLAINLALDISPQEILFEHVLGYVCNIIIFLAFGSFFINIFSIN